MCEQHRGNSFNPFLNGEENGMKNDTCKPGFILICVPTVTTIIFFSEIPVINDVCAFEDTQHCFNRWVVPWLTKILLKTIDNINMHFNFKYQILVASYVVSFNNQIICNCYRVQVEQTGPVDKYGDYDEVFVSNKFYNTRRQLNRVPTSHLRTYVNWQND